MGELERRFPDEVAAALGKYPAPRRAAAALDLLYLAQVAYGRITVAAAREVADLTGLEETHVQALVGFYGLFQDVPRGRWVVHYCTDLPCALAGADEFLATLVDRLGCRPGETSADGMFSLETTMCLAACHRAPVLQVNLEYFENMTVESLDGLVARLRELAAGDPPRRPPMGLGPPSDLAGSPA